MAIIKFRPWFKAKHPAAIPASLYKPIGQILVGYTYTELYMQSIAWHVLRLRDPKAARLLTIGRNAIDLEKLFRSLTPQWIKDQADAKELLDIHAKAQRIRADRNKLAHGIWGYKPGQKPRQMRLFYLRENEQKIKPEAMFITQSLLETWVANLAALNAQIKAFHRKLGAPVP